jgi:uncharacterized membrane protein
MEKIAWLVLTLVTLVAAIAAQRRPGALTVGRVTLGIYYVFAGALVNVVYLARGDTFASFADAAYFSFVRDTWRAVVAPNYLFFIGLLVIFEATMGVLVLTGGRRAELGMLGILGMQAGLLLFGWVTSVSAAVMLVAVGLLLRAQRRHDKQVAESLPRRAASVRSALRAV